MDESLKNPIKAAPLLLGNSLVYLKNVLLPGLNYLFKQELKEPVDFLRTVDNIQILGGYGSQGVALKGPAETEKNLLACVVSGEVQVLFFNISGAEFFDHYVGGGASRVRELLERTWNKAPLRIEHFGRRIITGCAQSRADANIANQASILAAGAYDKAEKEDFEQDLDRVLAESEKNNRGLNRDEKA